MGNTIFQLYRKSNPGLFNVNLSLKDIELIPATDAIEIPPPFSLSAAVSQPEISTAKLFSMGDLDAKDAASTPAVGSVLFEHNLKLLDCQSTPWTDLVWIEQVSLEHPTKTCASATRQLFAISPHSRTYVSKKPKNEFRQNSG